ncbi:hypothetical protein ACOMHN_027899 [Nucella lapillus]
MYTGTHFNIYTGTHFNMYTGTHFNMYTGAHFNMYTGTHFNTSTCIQDLGKYGLLYYNSLLMVGPSFAAAYFTGELDKAVAFEQWGDAVFVLAFLSSSAMGFLLNYSIILCTAYNSALTTTIVGVLKVGGCVVLCCVVLRCVVM